ncbi:MAG: hypothetical protein Q4B77_06475 [Coriobacteriaceae bacterium]|nr:hypothetical protein [Coriobacteriaceae bacterium]
MQANSSQARIDSLKQAIAQHMGDQKRGNSVATLITTVEPLLVLAMKYGNPMRADRANLLLSNLRLFNTQSFGERERVLQMARRHLTPITSTRNWQDMLNAYMDETTERYRMFDIMDNTIIARTKVFEGTGRDILYIEWLQEPPSPSTRMARAQAGIDYSYWAAPEQNRSRAASPSNIQSQGAMRKVAIPDYAPTPPVRPRPQDSSHKAMRAPITFTLSELIDAAGEIGRLTGKQHLAEVLTRAASLGLFKRIVGENAEPSEQITIEQVTNVVGIVGAGKSVLANVLTYACAKRGFRVAIVQNSIADVMDSLAFFEQLDVSASPLVSRRNRLAHLDELTSKNGEMLLDDVHARFLETPCLLDGMAENADTPTSYDSMPCFELKDQKGARHACPFIDTCPSQAMARAARTSKIVVTTPSGFAMITLGAERQPFFEHVLGDFDLVIFDEADRVQSQLDGLFAPSESFHEFVRDSADELARASKRPPAEKLLNANNERVIGLRSRAETAAKILASSARKPAIANWKELKNRTFTSLLLVELLRRNASSDNRGRLSPEILSDLEYIINLHGKLGKEREEPDISLLIDAVHVACEDIDSGFFQQKLNRYLEEKDVDVSPTLRDRLTFTVQAICFDNLLRELDRSSEALTHRDATMERLCNYLHASTSRQTPYLPASPVGNLCGFRITDEGDITLYRQFATGRALMTALPWLVTGKDGNPQGPHALLLSGSSYEPGCLQFHLNLPVDYLLDAPAEIAEFLSRSEVRDLGLDVRVSGSGSSRRKHLNLVLRAVTDTLIEELKDPRAGKALIIVNNYEEARAARDTLQSELRSRGCTEKVCSLVKEQESALGEARLMRSEVYLFASRPERILIAPAMAIERGFNIVDGMGHSCIDTLVFAVRPMGIPHDLGIRFKRVVGLSCNEARRLDTASPFFEQELRKAAWRCWMALEQDEALRLSDHASTDDCLCRDIIATLMVLIVQIFGRLARVRDFERRPPRIYFADAAFTGNRDPNVQDFRTLDLLKAYMSWLVSESEQPAVAQALYGPFYTALMKGIPS